VTYTAAELSQIKSDNYAPATIGQLKVVAKLFYDRLLNVGYDTRANLVSHGYPSNWAYFYPWNNPGTDNSINYTLANVGQLKCVFCFDLGSLAASTLVDSDNDALPDWWETSVAGGLNASPFGDFNNDGVKNISELVAEGSPTGSLTVGTSRVWVYTNLGQ
jgi:hypothetical protein